MRSHPLKGLILTAHQSMLILVIFTRWKAQKAAEDMRLKPSYQNTKARAQSPLKNYDTKSN